jgi:hypothetical protein
MTKHRCFGIVVTPLCLLASGCQGTVLEVGKWSDASPTAADVGTLPITADASSDSSEAPISEPSMDSAAEAFVPVCVSDLQIACRASHGAVAALQGVADAQQRLVGSWWLCSSEGTTAVAQYQTPIAFNADGTWNDLVPDPSRCLTLGTGADQQGTYSIQSTLSQASGDAGADAGPPAQSALVGLDRATGGANFATVSFETSPTRMLVNFYDLGIKNWYVPVEGSPDGSPSTR